MSQENVDVVRKSWEAFADRGLDGIDEYWHSDINWRAIEGAPDDVGEMKGREAARRYCEDWLDTFEDITTVPEELLDMDEDRVVALLHVTGRARLSGIETELRYAVAYTIREGKIVRVREYAEKAEAIEAVRLAK
jgi:ketosteroid isomerase-like protein